MQEITTEAQLRELLGDPAPAALTKERAGNRRADGYRKNIPHRTSG